VNPQRPSLPLSMVSPGEKVCLVEIRSTPALHKRLSDLGLSVGTVVRVVQGSSAGPLILASKEDSRLALGRGLAQQIMVTLTE